MSRCVWITTVLCVLVVLAGCQSSDQLLGGSDFNANQSATPSPVVTQTSTGTDGLETPTRHPRTTATDSHSFNETAFRTAFRADISDARATRGLPPLNWSAEHRRVADQLARELATAQYFGNATARNSSRFEIQTRLEQAGLACPRTVDDPQFVGGGFFLQNFYQTYVDTGGAIYYYETESELARAMTTQLLRPNSAAEQRQLSSTVFASAATAHGVGVYYTRNDTVYAVYVVC